ncbi:MAG TPA: hemolysin family protein [Euzebyales bacterium]|nr:hemolysin family protein [Euzebyales bacterium]
MNTIWGQLLLVAAFVLTNAAFAGTEIAMISLRDSQIARLATHGRAGRTLARLARDPNQFLATIQIGITLSGFMASATAAVTFSEPLVGPLSAWLGRWARPSAIVLVTLVLTYVMLTFGELAPKRLAMQRAERWALVAARPLAALAVVSRPAVWLLARSTDLVVRLFGGDPTRQREEISEAELRDMVAAQPELSAEERAIIGGAFELADRTLRQVLVPRNRIVACPHDTPVAEGARLLVKTGHSRAPVYREQLDDIVGIVHLRALFDAEGTVGDDVVPALLLPETATVLDSLRTMQAQRQQMAIVINEHGGVEGLVTIEDLVEELVGEIWDETDPDIQAVRHEPDGAMVVVGSYPVHDLVDLGVTAPTGDYTTVAGLILDELGRIPRPGEHVDIAGWRFEVVDATDRAIRRVRLFRAPGNDDGDDDAAR